MRTAKIYFRIKHIKLIYNERGEIYFVKSCVNQLLHCVKYAKIEIFFRPAFSPLQTESTI